LQQGGRVEKISEKSKHTPTHKWETERESLLATLCYVTLAKASTITNVTTVKL